MQAIKIRSGHQVRRDRIDENATMQNVTELFEQLFGRPLQDNTLRYKDDESEWIDFSTDRELKEAIRINNGKTLELQVREDRRSPCDRRRRHEREERCGRDRHHNGEHLHGHFPHHMPPPPPFHAPFFRAPMPPHRMPPHPLGSFFPDPRFRRSHEERQQGFVHPARCDKCDEFIVGLRHKCNECPDYDLCNNCIGQSSTVHPDHTFTTLEKSFPRWHHCHAEKPREEPQAESVVDATVVLEAEPEVPRDEPEAQDEVVEEQPQEEVPQAEAPAEPSVLDKSNLVERLKQLESMGFDDKQKNIRLLLACGGDMSLVMEQLLDA